MSVRWLYPIVLLGWSMAGVATGYADRIGKFLAPTLGPLLTRVWPDAAVNPESPSDCAFLGFLVCRVVLGLFEAGQWPCALPRPNMAQNTNIVVTSVAWSLSLANRFPDE